MSNQTKGISLELDLNVVEQVTAMQKQVMISLMFNSIKKKWKLESHKCVATKRNSALMLTGCVLRPLLVSGGPETSLVKTGCFLMGVPLKNHQHQN